MKLKLFTLPCLLFLFAVKSYGQVLWMETFNGADSNQFTLNTTDVINGTTCVSGSVYNQWAINNDYKGGTVSGISVCSGAGTVSGDINNTANEPVGVTGGPNSYYLHILCPLYASNNPKIFNASWCYAADGLFDFCPPAENYFAKMNVDVSTATNTNVYLKFYWACGGVTTYAQAYYSTDGGNTWTQAGSNFTGQSAWQLDSIHLAAFDNQATLRFGFLWVSPYTDFAASGNDPAIALDDISIEVPGTVTPDSIITGSVTGSPFCAGQTISVPYTTKGTITGTYTVELSNSSGSFISPTTIGTGTTSPITATIPAGTATGNGYKVQVVNGSATVTPSASFIVNASVAASVTISSSSGNIMCTGTGTTFTASGTNGGLNPSYQWKVNGGNVGTNSATYTTSSLSNGDVVTCELTSDASCVTGSPAPSNSLTMTVTTSGPVTVSITASPGTNVCPGTTITYNTNVIGGGSAPTYVWQDSGKTIPGATSSTFVDANPRNNDHITCIVVSNSPCVTGGPGTSNEVDITVNTGGVKGGTINTNGDTVVCTKTIASLSLVGYTGSTIQWQSSVTGATFTDVSSGGTTASYNTGLLTKDTYYRVEVSSGSCSAYSDTVKLHVVAPPSGSFSFTSVGPTVTFNSSGITGATGYSWNFGDGTSNSTQPNPVHTFDSTNVPYDVCLTATNNSNCTNSICLNVTVFPLGINNISLEKDWLIYPDPFTDQLYISSTSTGGNIQQIEIYDVLGRIVLQQRMNGSTSQPLQVDVSALKEGVYFLRIDTGTGSLEKSVIKQ